MRLQSYLTETKKNIVIKTLNQMNDKDVKDFFSLMKYGDSYSNIDSIKKYGLFFGFAYVDDILASVAAIKNNYRVDDVFEASETEENPDDYNYEIGWAYTLPEYRKMGLNKSLYKELLSKVSGGVIATVRLGNNISTNSLKSLGFEITGDEIVSTNKIYLMIKKP